MSIIYPAMIAEHEKDYLVFVPDLDTFTEGKSYPEAILMARDAIGIYLVTIQEAGEAMPTASDYAQAIQIAKEKADDKDVQYSAGIPTMIDVDVEAYRRKHDSRMVKKNCTIPYYLDEQARKAGLNFSRVLQEALAERLAN